MKASAPPYLVLLLAPLGLLSLNAQEASTAATADAVARLEASKNFTVGSTASLPESGPGQDLNGLTPDRSDIDLSRAMSGGSWNKLFFATPPPEVLQPQLPRQRPVRRYDASLPNKEADWLLKGIEEQRKLLEQQQKGLNKDTALNGLSQDPLKADSNNDPARRDKDNDKDKNLDHTAKTSSNNSHPLTTLGVYSRYTLGGLDSIKPSSGSVDPLGINGVGQDSAFKSNLSPSADPVSDPIKATDINSPIIDPLTTAKLDTSSANNSRINVNNWLASVKEKERAALLPQQAPSVQDFYDKSQVRPKPPADLTAKPKPIVDSRPKASTLKNSLPPNRTIKDPNDF